MTIVEFKNYNKTNTMPCEWIGQGYGYKEFVFYKSEGYWNHVFCVRVRKSGYTYNSMMKLINAIYAPKYKKVNHTINDEGKVVVEV